jgi:hypothetical protein
MSDLKLVDWDYLEDNWYRCHYDLGDNIVMSFIEKRYQDLFDPINLLTESEHNEQIDEMMMNFEI